MSDITDLKRIIEQEENIEDFADSEEESDSCRYDITSYGIDFDVEGLVRRLKRKDIFIPHFQRDFVWKLPESSRFIESLLIGLPVPGIFLAQESSSGKMLVIDGQQRLLSLLFYYEGYFNPKEGAKSDRIFKLTKVKSEFEGKTYELLDPKDRINLDNSVIHATVVKQESPADSDSSIYHIFERLNSGGRKLTTQEIRVAVYHGPLIALASELNEVPAWRAIFGQTNDRLKDQELILRFFSLFESGDSYTKPMVEFINSYCALNRDISLEKASSLRSLFMDVTKLFITAVPEKLFRPGRALNVALFDCCMVGLAKRISIGRAIDPDTVRAVYTQLLENKQIQALISQSTSDAKGVKERLQIATDLFCEA